MRIWDQILQALGINSTQLKWRWRRFRSGLGKDAADRPKPRLVEVTDPTPWVTTVLCLLCVAFYAGTVKVSQSDLYEGISPTTRALILYGANDTLFVGTFHEWWLLVTANFLHGGVAHLLMNTYGLWVIGGTVERMFGWQRALVAFVLTGVAGHAASFGWRLYRDSQVPSVGASTAIFGLLSLIVAYSLRDKGRGGQELRAAFLPWLLFSLFIGFSMPQVDNAGHIGGMIAGAPLGYFLGDLRSARRAPGSLWATLAILCSGLVVFSFYKVFTFHQPLVAELLRQSGL